MQAYLTGNLDLWDGGRDTLRSSDPNIRSGIHRWKDSEAPSATPDRFAR